MIELTCRTDALIEKIVPLSDRDRIRQRIQEEAADNLPNCENHGPEEMERIRFSILRLIHESGVQMETYAFRLASSNWRDLLVVADHGHHLDAHNAWADSVLNVHA